ncbi:MAG: hypothetical protein KDA96_18320, partial [Planctomycetaceae bacterium]|nr:hypothetical protein [Planctomycetaceae bacterium]
MTVDLSDSEPHIPPLDSSSRDRKEPPEVSSNPPTTAAETPPSSGHPLLTISDQQFLRYLLGCFLVLFAIEWGWIAAQRTQPLEIQRSPEF